MIEILDEIDQYRNRAHKLRSSILNRLLLPLYVKWSTKATLARGLGKVGLDVYGADEFRLQKVGK